MSSDMFNFLALVQPYMHACKVLNNLLFLLLFLLMDWGLVVQECLAMSQGMFDGLFSGAAVHACMHACMHA